MIPISVAQVAFSIFRCMAVGSNINIEIEGDELWQALGFKSGISRDSFVLYSGLFVLAW